LGTRLYPITTVVSKQLLPVFDKPMIYYPLSILMFAGIRQILIITTPEDQHLFKRLLGDGADIGLQFSYIQQERPRGLADALILGAEFIGSDRVARQHFLRSQPARDFGARHGTARQSGSTIFGYSVNTPQQYGVVELDRSGRALSIEEKPLQPKLNIAVTGLYFYDNDVVSIAKTIKTSVRGKLEITDVNLAYLQRGDLHVELLGRGFVWLDTGTHTALLEASQFIQTLEQRQGLRVACPEEIALRLGYISLERFKYLAKRYAKSSYGEYLSKVPDSIAAAVKTGC
jgi:glucose-1-phosphate thymidylyltransferase